MKVSVRLFAIARQTAGRDSVALELPEGATIGLLRRQLGIQIPSLAGQLPAMLFALNARYADDRAVIPPDAEIACIPPVSGG